MPNKLLSEFRYEDKFIPATEDIFVGKQDRENYRLIGISYLERLISLCSLKHDSKVLDVGCGSGRLAVPVAWYIINGYYYGIDIVPSGIQWCREKIKPHFPNTQFDLADIFNARYNSKGKENASTYHFPYSNDTFDVVFLTSVFTHMLVDDVENYTSEIYRVLKPNGHCLITFFIYDDDSKKGIKQDRSKFPFKYDHGKYLTIDPNLHEGAVAYRLEYIEDLFYRNNLKIKYKENGTWRWHKEGTRNKAQIGKAQDVIVVIK